MPISTPLRNQRQMIMANQFRYIAENWGKQMKKKEEAKATTPANDPNLSQEGERTDEAAAPNDQEEVQQPSLEDPNSDSQQDADGDTTTISCQTSTHLKTYPLIQETNKFIDDFPITKAIKSTTFPTLKSIGGFAHSQSLLKPIITTVDELGESTLSTAENWMPCLKTAHWEDVLDTVKAPIISTDDAIKNAAIATNDCVEMRILTPTRTMVRNGRAYYNEHLYDTKGKPLIRSSLDPIFKPINHQIEIFTLKNFQESEPISDEYTSEIERNLYLSIDLIDRSIPVVEKKIVDAVMIPCNMKSHAFDVYNENLTKQDGNTLASSMKATYNTSIDLSTEVWDETTGLWKKIWNSDRSNEESENHDVLESNPTGNHEVSENKDVKGEADKIDSNVNDHADPKLN